MTARVVDDALIANGDLALFVKPVEGGPFDFESRFPPRLVQRLADGAQALTLLGMNVYDLEPQREFEVRFPKVTATNARTHLAIGWTWNGIDVDQGGDVFEPGMTRAFSAKLTAPDGAQLWWDFGDGKFEAPAHRQPLASPVTVIDDP